MFYIITADFIKPWKVGEDIKRIVESFQSLKIWAMKIK